MAFNFSTSSHAVRADFLQELAPDEAAFRAVMTPVRAQPALRSLPRASNQDRGVVLTTDHGGWGARRAGTATAHSTNPRGHGSTFTDPAGVIIRKPMD
jgi:hypothetical protein